MPADIIRKQWCGINNSMQYAMDDADNSKKSVIVKVTWSYDNNDHQFW